MSEFGLMKKSKFKSSLNSLNLLNLNDDLIEALVELLERTNDDYIYI